MPSLVVLQGGKAVEHPLRGDETFIGRHPDCAIQLQANAVSRKHARIFHEGGDYLIEDLGSGNGTFVNGRRIVERVVLKHEDRLRFGPLLMRFELTERTASATAAAAVAAAGLAETRSFNVRIDDEADGSTIVSAVDNTSGFGVLHVRPEVKLKAVVDISRRLAGTVEIGEHLPRILDTLFDIFPQADRGCILLKDRDTQEMIPRALKHRRESDDATVKLSRTIVRKVLAERTGVLSADASKDAQFQASESISDLSIRSVMCVPLLGLEGEPIGIINLDTHNPISQFSRDDLDLLLAVAGQAALSYEGARLLVSHMDKLKQDNEMEIARGVQRALLPEELPRVAGYEFYASYESAQAVGGDYYDAMMLGDDKVCLAFGDVAGKGVPGALIMSRIASCVQNTMAFVHDVGAAIAAINTHMCANAVEGRFVTFVLAVIDLAAHELSLANAGHMSPMIRTRDGKVEEFDDETTGIPIGVMADYPFDVVTRAIAPGETIVLFTDGVDEAMNPDGELYTLERMREVIGGRVGKARELGEALLADVRRHAAGRPQHDDIAIMTFGRDPH